MKTSDMTRPDLELRAKNLQSEIDDLEVEISDLESRKDNREDELYDIEQELKLFVGNERLIDREEQKRLDEEAERQQRYLNRWLRPGRKLSDYWFM